MGGLQRGNSVAREKVFGFVGLGLFCLFPLVGVFQLGDADDTWRQVAARTRPSVLQIGAGATPPVSAVVVGTSPLRVAVAGNITDPALTSQVDGGTVEWQPCYNDPQGEFTVLQAAAAIRPTVHAGPAVDPAAIGDVAVLPEDQSAVSAVLVAPASLPEVSMWVGVLTPERAPDGRPSFHGNALRPLRNDALASAEAETVAPLVDPALCGAPFVTRDGVVLALYAGIRDGRVHAVPMALVRDAVATLDRRAAR
jgi:hypothetical protein